MKPQKLLLITLLTLFSFPLMAQEKLAAVNTGKSKAKSERSFSVIEKGALVTKASIRKDPRSTANVIEIEALNISGGSISLGKASIGESPVLPPAEISNITSLIGNYASLREVSRSGRGVVLQMLEVNYPYRARMTVAEQIFEFEIKEPGFWRVSVAVSK